MTKLIAILIILVAIFGGWELFQYWDKVRNENETLEKQAAAQVVPEQLPGLPGQLQPSLQAAQQHGATALGAWLKAYGPAVQDPRKAWIELDYCQLISRDDPALARRIFADVKNRTPQSSPVWPRIQQLAKTYE